MLLAIYFLNFLEEAYFLTNLFGLAINTAVRYGIIRYADKPIPNKFFFYITHINFKGCIPYFSHTYDEKFIRYNFAYNFSRYL